MGVRRRDLAAGLIGMAAPRFATAQLSDRAVLVLIHGAWHGGWCWQRVTPLLRAAGHEVHVITLTGLGDRAHLLAASVNLDTHINDIRSYLDMEDLHDVTLVGHSYSGIVISGVADRAPQRLAKLIYLDSLLLNSGESVFSRWYPPEQHAAILEESKVKTGGLGIPPRAAKTFGVPPCDQAWVDERLRPQPLGCYLQTLHLNGPLGAGLPKTYIQCMKSAPSAMTAMKEEISRAPDWEHVRLESGHDAMIDAPAALSTLLIQHSSKSVRRPPHPDCSAR